MVAGNFDVIHPGYIKMFKESKENCDTLLVLLHTDPTIERPEKIKPIFINPRTCGEISMSIKYIDGIYTYDTESDLLELLKFLNPSVRFLEMTTRIGHLLEMN